MQMVSVYSLFFCKQKTAYEMRISNWSSDVCSSDLFLGRRGHDVLEHAAERALLLLAHRRLERDDRLAQRTRRLAHLVGRHGHELRQPIGRASCRARVCQYVQLLVVAGLLKKSPPLISTIHLPYIQLHTSDRL